MTGIVPYTGSLLISSQTSYPLRSGSRTSSRTRPMPPRRTRASASAPVDASTTEYPPRRSQLARTYRLDGVSSTRSTSPASSLIGDSRCGPFPGQPDGERAAVTGLAGDGQRATEDLHQSAGVGQAQTGSGHRCLDWVADLMELLEDAFVFG